MTNEVLRQFGRIIKTHRQQRGLTQDALAERAGLHHNHIGYIERGEKSPTLLVILKIATVLEVPASTLINELEENT